MTPELYAAEMRRLHESAQEFAEAHPEQAGMLNMHELRDKDPYVERLLEGVAFLTGQIRERIDDDIPEISESLLHQIAPQLLKPFPCATIMEMSSRVGQLQQTKTIASKTLFTSGQVGNENTICKFHSVGDVSVNPIRVQDLDVSDGQSGGTVFKITLEVDAGVKLSELDLSDLQFYLHADPALAVNLYLALTANCKKVSVNFPDMPTMLPRVVGHTNVITGSRLGITDSLLPLSGRSFPGFRLLHDYFSFREKFLFVKVNGLQQVAWPNKCQKIQLIIQSDSVMPREHKLAKDAFRLHCVPAINLHDGTTEPLTLNHERAEYPLVADARSRESILVYSVNEVIGTTEKSHKPRVFHSLYSFKSRMQRDSVHYHVSRREYRKKHPALTLAIGGDKLFNKERLSCHVTEYNGDYPRKFLKEGSVNVPMAGFPAMLSFKNLLRPSQCLMPPERKDFQWQLISHMSLNYHTIETVEALQRLLSIYDWSGRIENRKRIEGIEALNIKTIEVIKRGALRRGIEFHLTLQDVNYYSEGDMYLFANVLHNFFTMYADINMFVQTRVIAQKSHKEWVWQAQLDDASR